MEKKLPYMRALLMKYNANANECENVEVGYNSEMFYVRVCGRRAVRLLYRVEDGVFHLVSTYTLKAFRGKGLASKAVREALNYALNRGFRKLKVSCSFVKGWLERHPEFKEKFEEIVYA